MARNTRYPPSPSPTANAFPLQPPPRTTARRATVAYVVLASFFAVFLVLGFGNGNTSDFEQLDFEAFSVNLPDFQKYRPLASLSASEIDLERPGRRVFFVGDIHGMRKPLHSLLNRISYDSTLDLFIHVGDIVAKGPDSGLVLTELARRNVTGVRGNHDQKVIEWRGWIEWVQMQKGGRAWLRTMEQKSADDLEAEKAKSGRLWKIPKDWEFAGDHYWIARNMKQSEYAYLLQLPLVLHLPSIHTMVVHAGLLPLDPNHSISSKHQPLSHIPSLSPRNPRTPEDTEALREAQELALIQDVPQNTIPWNLLNMRSVKGDGEVLRNKKGKAWASMWNNVVNRCNGFDTAMTEDESEILDWEENDDVLMKKRPHQLPCHPATVIYGHAASRGLDIKSWSKGLDTGCVYGRRLTALVLAQPAMLEGLSTLGSDDEDGEFMVEDISVGEEHMPGRIVSARCG